MPRFHLAQLPDGRCIKIRELTSAMQASVYEAAAERLPGGGFSTPNPVKADTECFKMALCGITDPQPLYQKDATGNPVPKLDPTTGKPMLRPTTGQPMYQRLDPSTLPPEAWKPLTYGELELRYDDLFGPKDRFVITQLYAAAHSPSEEERDFFETIRSVAASG